MVKWTDQQKQAINLKDTEILVSAAAGSGKTATLIERIVNILSDETQNVECENLLVTTFTNAAAGEIKERIRKALKDKIQNNPDNRYIYKQYKNISRATISTLHAFCSEIIRKNASLIDVDPGFSVADESIADKFLQDAINSVYEEYLNNHDDAFSNLLSTFGYGKNFNTLTDLIISVIKTVKSYPDYEQWLEKSAKKALITEDNIFHSEYGNEILTYTRRRLKDCVKYIENLQNTLCGSYEESHYQPMIEDDLGLIYSITEIVDSYNWDKLKEHLESVKFNAMPRKKMDFDISVVDIVKDYRDKVKSVIKVITAQLYDSEVNIKNDCVFMHCTIMKFIETIIRTNEKYSKIKIKAKLIDYADMEHMALKCLKSGANLLYKEKFKHILIDEYQDFNFIQENIINLISNKNNVFAVGDLKQSIYKFRNAQTAIFKEKSTRFCNFNEGRKLSLSYNFRSRKKILNYVNEIFSNIMNEDFGEVEYGDEEKLMYGAFQYSDELDNSDYLPSVIKIRFDKSDDIINSDITQNEAEVYIVADQIKKVIESKMKIHDSISNKFRPVRSSDIVILMRSVNAYAKQYCEILNKCGILAHCEQNIEILDKKSISDLLALLNIIDNPYQDIYLVQIMKNEVYNFNESELAFIRRGKYGLYDDLVSYPENDKLKLKIARFLNDIKDMWMFSQRNTVEKTIYYAMTKSGIYYLSKEQHLLKKFYVLSVECLQKGIDDLSSFLNFIKSKSKKDLTIISDVMRTEENESVRIMSIHKSKGLEFPVVILTGCSRGFNIEDTKKRLIIDRNLGIGSDYINCDNKTYHKHITKNALSLSIKKQNLSEEMRILYVALTRAKEKLIITGIDKQTEPAYVPEDAKNYFDWILPNTDKSLIQTITEAECDIKISELTKRSELADNCNMKVFDSSFYQDIMKKISFEYPYNEEIKLNRKLSVTELTKYQSKNYSIEDFYDQYHTNPKKQPSFLDKNQKSINAAKKGTIMHKIMASVDLKKLNDPNYISYLKSKIGENEYINNLISFISTPIYNEIIDAETIFQEKVFFMPVNTSYIESFTGHHFEKDHIILLQGVIDCFFIKNGFGTIIDYKTDKIKKGQEEQHALKYKNQLDIYANAIENIMGIKISNKIIHFFETNTNIDLNLI